MNVKKTCFYKTIRRNVKKAITAIDRIKYRTYCFPADINEEVLLQLEDELSNYVPVELISKTVIQSEELLKFEKSFNFKEYYDTHWSRYYRKISEYFLVYNFFNNFRTRDFVYVDAASSSSKWAYLLKQKFGINAYSVDLVTPADATECFLQSDITSLPFEDQSVDGISIQSAMELLPGDTDIRFIKECGRVLKKGGKAIISPLYLNPRYCNCFGKSYYMNAVTEEDAVKCLRLDHDLEFTRLYNVETLKRRVLETAERCGMKYKVVVVEADNKIELVDKENSFIYLHFCLVLEKN